MRRKRLLAKLLAGTLVLTSGILPPQKVKAEEIADDQKIVDSVNEKSESTEETEQDTVPENTKEQNDVKLIEQEEEILSSDVEEQSDVEIAEMDEEILSEDSAEQYDTEITEMDADILLEEDTNLDILQAFSAEEPYEYVYFGHYLQEDTNGDGMVDDQDEKEPIKWRILSKEGNDAYVLSEYLLDSHQYHGRYTEITWEHCTLRQWLNNEFYNAAFTSAEQGTIIAQTVVNGIGCELGYPPKENNTLDKVYLPSGADVCNLFYGFSAAEVDRIGDEYNSERVGIATAYAKQRGVGELSNGNSVWWLRETGYCNAAGCIDDMGMVRATAVIYHFGVRPAMHINLNSEYVTKEPIAVEPTIQKQPNCVTVEEGQTAIFSVGATGTALQYQWQYSTDSGKTWKNNTISGSNTASIQVETTLKKNGYQYHCIVTDENGKSVTSNTASLTVTPKYVYFGHYLQEDTNSDGVLDDNDEKQSIKWRILSKDGNDAYVMSEYILDYKIYNWRTDVTWETCTLRKWLNNEFLNMAFTADEQGAIIEQAIVNDDNPEYGTPGGKNTTDKVYLPSRADMFNTVYGFSVDNHYCGDSIRKGFATDYAKQQGASVDCYDGSCAWWLRSPGNNANRALVVTQSGYMSDFYVDYSAGVRPAMHINLSSSLVTKEPTTVTIITKQPQNVIIEEGKMATFSVVATGTGLKYQWQYSTDNGKTWKNNTVSGCKTSSMPIEAIAKRDGYQYHCIVTDENGKSLTSNPAKLTVTGECVYFGHYLQEDTNSDGWVDDKDEKQSIKWRILSRNGDDAYVLSEYVLDCKLYDELTNSKYWEDCTLRAWLNNDFYNMAFTSAEQSAIIEQTLVNNFDSWDGPHNTKDKVYIPSVADMVNPDYGFSSDVTNMPSPTPSNAGYHLFLVLMSSYPIFIYPKSSSSSVS